MARFHSHVDTPILATAYHAHDPLYACTYVVRAMFLHAYPVRALIFRTLSMCTFFHASLSYTHHVVMCTLLSCVPYFVCTELLCALCHALPILCTPPCTSYLVHIPDLCTPLFCACPLSICAHCVCLQCLRPFATALICASSFTCSHFSLATSAARVQMHKK